MRQWMMAVVAAVAAVAAPRAEVIDRVLATVGSQIVTQSDVRAAETFGLIPPSVKAAGAPDTLGQLVDRQLVLN